MQSMLQFYYSSLVFSSELCYPFNRAGVAELADALDSKSSWKQCGFESRRRHIYKRPMNKVFPYSWVF